MADKCGMANASVYFKWVNKKTSGGKIKYLLKFLANTGKTINDLFPNGNIQVTEPELLTVQDAEVEMYSCPDCRPRVKKINNQATRIKDLEYTIEVQKELIEKLRGSICK